MDSYSQNSTKNGDTHAKSWPSVNGSGADFPPDFAVHSDPYNSAFNFPAQNPHQFANLWRTTPPDQMRENGFSSGVHPQNGETSFNLFPQSRFERKRKIPSPETFRSSKVLVTEAALKLNSMQLANGTTPPGQFAPTSCSSSSVVQPTPVEAMEPETWQTFMDSDFMDVDAEPSGRRVCPQLEMSDSLKEAIRLIDMDENAILPSVISSQIILPASASCMALVPYKPPPQPKLLPAMTESTETKRNGKSRSDPLEFSTSSQMTMDED